MARQAAAHSHNARSSQPAVLMHAVNGQRSPTPRTVSRPCASKLHGGQIQLLLLLRLLWLLLRLLCVLRLLPRRRRAGRRRRGSLPLRLACSSGGSPSW